MKTFSEHLNEAKEDDIDANVYGEDNYKFVTGRGRWWFASKKSINFDVDKEGVDYIISKGEYSLQRCQKSSSKMG